jgi:hypothetical protein
LPSIASLQRTVSTPPLVDFRAPRLWIFLSSLPGVDESSVLPKDFRYFEREGRSDEFKGSNEAEYDDVVPQEAIVSQCHSEAEPKNL